MTEILKPEEVKRRRQATTTIEIEEDIISQESEVSENTGGKVKIELESMGRFGLPKVVYFSDYTGRDQNDIALSPPEDLLNNLLSVLNKNKYSTQDFIIDNMTAEDLLEILVGIQIQFDKPVIEYYWVCQCQSEIEEADRIIHDMPLDLTTLNYKSIEDADKEMRSILADMLNAISDSQYKDYLYKKYKDNPLEDVDSWTREKEIETIKVKEPFTFIYGNDTYAVRYPRVKDLLKAKKYVFDKYNPKLKSIQNRKEHGVALHILKEKKEEETKAIKNEMARQLILYAKSMILISKNDKELTDIEKFNEYSDNMSRSIRDRIDEVFSNIQFGLQHEIDLECPICGKSERRLLQHNLDPRQLLPFGDRRNDKNISPKGNGGNDSGFTFYFGV